MKWSRLILAVALVVGLASIVRAGSKWVLWSHYMSVDVKPSGEIVGVTVKTWDVQNAFEDRRECLEQAEKYIKGQANVYQKQNKPATVSKDEMTGRSRIELDYDKHKEIVSAVCLPETVDPREKK